MQERFNIFVNLGILSRRQKLKTLSSFYSDQHSFGYGTFDTNLSYPTVIWQVIT